MNERMNPHIEYFILYCINYNTSASIAICNQKGGVGKSTFTVLLASYLHSSWDKTFERRIATIFNDLPVKQTEPQKPPIPPVASSKTPEMEIRKAMRIARRRALRISISGV